MMPCPPKSYWQLWSHFMHCHVTPYCKSQSIQWFPKISATYVNIFFRHHSNFKLYKFDSGEATEYDFLTVCKKQVIFWNVPHQSSMSPSDSALYAVEVAYNTKGLVYFGRTNINHHSADALPSSFGKSLSEDF